jgi:hypothetical protein
LRERPYGTSRDAWLAGVQRPLEARTPWGRRQLMDLLRRVMIRRAARLLTRDAAANPSFRRNQVLQARAPRDMVKLRKEAARCWLCSN